MNALTLSDWLFLLTLGSLLGWLIDSAIDRFTARYERRGWRPVRRWYAPGTLVYHRTRGPLMVRAIDTTPALGQVWVYGESAHPGHPAAWVPLSALHTDAAALLSAAAEAGRRHRSERGEPG